MPSFHELVILFTRYPQVGKCKSRLIPALGAEGALRIHRQLVSHVLIKVEKYLSSKNDTEFQIFHDGGTEKQMQQWLGNKHTFKRQEGDNLGDRMACTLIQGLKNKHNTILFGSDCPGINQNILGESLEALQCNDMVLGPAHDGGYYLIGVAGNISNNTCRQLFEDIPWGTEQVFAKTLQHADTLGLNTHILSKLHDIDTAEDLKYFHHCSDAE